MTHSGGKPHNVGDKGQRFQLSAFGYPKEEKSVIGWHSTREGINRMRDAISSAPRCQGTEVFDRETDEYFTIMFAKS